MKKLLIAIILISQIFALQAAGKADHMKEIEKVLAKEEKSFKEGGFTFALADSDQLLYSEYFGSMTENSRTLSASVTKLFTAAAVTKLAEEGRLSLDAPLNHMIENFELADGRGEEVTLRRMLTHYSPLPSDFLKGYIQPEQSEKDVHGPTIKMIERLKEEWSPTPGDMAYRYSNIAYELAAYSIYKATGRPYPQYIREEFLKPLGMDHSGFPYSGDAALPADPGFGKEGETSYLALRGVGEGDLVSTSKDLIRYGQLFLTDGESPILSSNSRKTMLDQHNRSALYDFDLYRGLGWYRSEIPGYKDLHYYYHEGGTHPFSALLIIIPSLNKTMAFMANENEHSFDRLSIKILQSLAEESTGRAPQYDEENRTEPLPEKYYGTYATELGQMTISEGRRGPILEMMGMNLHIKELYNGHYGLEMRLLGLIPLPIEDLISITFQFDDKGIERFGFYTNGKYRGLGTKFISDEMDSRWQSRLGEYEIINNDENNFLNSFHLQENAVSLTVATLTDQLVFPLDMTSGDHALIEGMGRHMGDRISVLHKGDEEILLYSGYYLKKK